MAEIRFEATKDIVRHWAAVRTGPHAPLRRDISPRAIAALLPHVFIVGNEGRDWAFRLSGSGMYDAYGMEMTGQAFSCVWGSETRRVSACLVEAAHYVRPLVIHSESSSVEGSVFTETVMMPLRSSEDHADIDRFIGLQTFAHPIPWWLGNRAISDVTITSMDLVRDDSARREEERKGREVPAMKRVSVPTRLRVFEGGLSA